jgi:hypothetical protein
MKGAEQRVLQLIRRIKAKMWWIRGGGTAVHGGMEWEHERK